MPDILLTTLNAKYPHTAFGLRYLHANLGELRPAAEILEFDIHHRPVDVVEALLAREPRIIGLGIYIWNVTQSTQVVSLLKRLRPGIRVVLGGPEVSHETEGQPIVALADHVITGEADLAFADLCRQILAGDPPAERILAAPLPELSRLAFPYDGYTPEDLAHRVVYLEASRGCPFSCEFCLSSLDVPVRQFPLEPFLAELQRLMDRGLTRFKFVDRTFNLNLQTSRALLRYFLERHVEGRFYHFEMIPDRLPSELREIIARFPAGSVQFEVGIQTFHPLSSQLISRRQSLPRLEENLRFLRAETGVHVHADLIVGLPGEDLESFGRGFDRLLGLQPQEIQVGILKRLRGTPIIRHDSEWGMVYSPDPPYEVLQTRLIPFGEMQRMRRFARYWDLVGNSGNFPRSAPLIWAGGESPFASFLRFSDWLFLQVRRTDQISLVRLAALLFRYLTEVRGRVPAEAAEGVLADYARGGHTDTPGFLAPYLPEAQLPGPGLPRKARLPRRQARHQVGPPPGSPG